MVRRLGAGESCRADSIGRAVNAGPNQPAGVPVRVATGCPGLAARPPAGRPSLAETEVRGADAGDALGSQPTHFAIDTASSALAAGTYRQGRAMIARGWDGIPPTRCRSASGPGRTWRSSQRCWATRRWHAARSRASRATRRRSDAIGRRALYSAHCHERNSLGRRDPAAAEADARTVLPPRYAMAQIGRAFDRAGVRLGDGLLREVRHHREPMPIR